MVLGKLSPREIAPSPNSNANPKPNPDPERGQFYGKWTLGKHVESKDEIWVSPVLHLLVFLLHTMLLLLVVLFVIKLYVRNNTFMLHTDI